MTDKSNENARVEVHFDEDGSVSEVDVWLCISGRQVLLEFFGDDVTLFAFYPEDAARVDGEPTEIAAIVLPNKELPEHDDE